MAISSKTIKTIVLSLVALCVLFVGALVFFIFYQSRTDVSTEQPYANFLNTPIVIKNVASMRWNANVLRFSNYSLNESDGSSFDYGDVKTVKHYQIGDTLIFHQAKKYASMHVGDTYYLIGRDTLDTGEAIEFEYYFQDKYYFNIWETEAEFLERVKKD